MAMEFMEDEKLVSVNCSDGDMNKKMRSPVSEIKSFADVVRITPQVVPVDAERGECDAGKVEYMVESPDNAVEVEVIPTPPLATEENLRFSLRNVQSKMEDVQLKAAAVVKKRNAEGLLTGDDKLAMERGAKMLKRNVSNMLRICASQRMVADG
ncbi:hypothetical protein D1007_17334 [Hordeum vulgare]|nr:hypothetical protein D1007_17334 [Hordeum vulgare]